MKRNRTPSDAMRDLVSDAHLAYWLSDRGKRTPKDRIGWFVERLPTSERELLSQLKSSDTDKDRWPLY